MSFLSFVGSTFTPRPPPGNPAKLKFQRAALSNHCLLCGEFCHPGVHPGPGTIDTARMDVLGREALWARTVQAIPMKRAATDEEVAGLIAYLCSPIAEYITGQSINIDGGMVMW